MEINPAIEPTADGSQTLRHPLSGEAYHSLNGALTESGHVFIRNGFGAVSHAHVRILEIGFGSGLNALLTLRECAGAGTGTGTGVGVGVGVSVGTCAGAGVGTCAGGGDAPNPLQPIRTVNYTAVELYPVSIAAVAAMDLAADADFMKLHNAPWGVPYAVSDRFTLHKIESDLADLKFETTFDLVYFDAFAPDAQPELWTPAIFGKIFDSMAAGGILVTYSAKGDVKRALRSVGFTVERLAGAPGKRHMLRAVKPLEA